MSVIGIGEGLYKIVCLRKFSRFNDFLVSSILIAPTKIFGNGSGKEDIFLQDHRNGSTECIQIVFTHVMATYAYAAGRNVIKTGNELHQG